MQSGLRDYTAGTTASATDDERNYDGDDNDDHVNHFDDMEHRDDCDVCDGSGVRTVTTVNGDARAVPCFVGMIGLPYGDTDE